MPAWGKPRGVISHISMKRMSFIEVFLQTQDTCAKKERDALLDSRRKKKKKRIVSFQYLCVIPLLGVLRYKWKAGELPQ